MDEEDTLYNMAMRLIAAHPLCYYDRKGRRIKDAFMLERLLFDVNYKHVRVDRAGDYYVSTVWLGLDHSYPRGEGPPIIFETMVFLYDSGLGHDYDMERYSTEEDAIQGHRRMVKKWRLIKHEEVSHE